MAKNGRKKLSNSQRRRRANQKKAVPPATGGTITVHSPLVSGDPGAQSRPPADRPTPKPPSRPASGAGADTTVPEKSKGTPQGEPVTGGDVGSMSRPGAFLNSPLLPS